MNTKIKKDEVGSKSKVQFKEKAGPTKKLVSFVKNLPGKS